MQALRTQYVAEFEALEAQVDLAVAAFTARYPASQKADDNNHAPAEFEPNVTMHMPKMTRAERRHLEATGELSIVR